MPKYKRKKDWYGESYVSFFIPLISIHIIYATIDDLGKGKEETKMMREFETNASCLMREAKYRRIPMKGTG